MFLFRVVRLFKEERYFSDMRHRWFKLFFVELPLFAFVGLFVWVTMKALPSPAGGASIFELYVTSHLQYLTLPLLLYFFFLVLYIVIGTQISSRYNSPQRDLGTRSVRYAFALAAILIVSLPLSFVVTYVVAFMQINYAIYSYNYKDAQKDILTSPQAIADAITYTDKLSMTTLSPDTYKKDILLLYMKQKNGFYEEKFLPGFPYVLYQRSYIPYSTLFLTNNTLVATSISKRDLSIISPALGKMIIEHSLLDPIQKGLPTVDILSHDAYIDFRKRSIVTQVSKIDDVIYAVDDRIATVSAFIAENENAISKNNNLKETTLAKQQSITCKTPEKCEAAKEKLQKIVDQADKNIANATIAMQGNQQVLGATITNKNTLITKRNELAGTQELTEYELGVFVPENKIKMTLDTESEDVFDAYISTLAHEYLHYFSYVDAEHKLDHFFEEGLTEYFARIAVQHYTGKSLDLGYPMSYRIIEAMVNDIPKREFFNVYVEKDQKALEALLDKTYGKSFYKTNAAILNQLSYLPFDQSLDAANIIMADINAKPLNKEDFTKK